MICWGCWVGWARRHHALRVEIAYEKYTYMYMFYASLRALCLYNFNIDSQKLRYISKIARESSWIRVRNEFNTLSKGGGGKGAKSRVCHKVYIFISLHTHACYLAVYLSVCEGVCMWVYMTRLAKQKAIFHKSCAPPWAVNPQLQATYHISSSPSLPLFLSSLLHLCVPAILRLHLTFFSRNTL